MFTASPIFATTPMTKEAFKPFAFNDVEPTGMLGVVFYTAQSGLLEKLFRERELGYGTARGRQGGDSGKETVETFMASGLAYWWSEGLELSQS
jgi:hypothetical protein